MKPRKKQMKHKHAEVIKAWAEGAEIEYSFAHNIWYPVDKDPLWSSLGTFRIKPTPKPDVVKYLQVSSGSHGLVPHPKRFNCDNLKLTFDGETHKLKFSEVI
jgi:hypothetical protein